MAQNLTYTRCGDYYIPDIRLAHTGTQPLGKYGRMRRAFLEQNNPMLFNDRAKVTAVYHNWQQEGFEETYENVPEFCYSASYDEVKEKGFTLVPSRYIEFVNRDENIDFDTKMKALQTELAELLVAEEKSKADLLSVFKELGYEIKL